MTARITPLAPADLEVVRVLVRDPSLVAEYDLLAIAGILEDVFVDPFFAREHSALAWEDDRPVGFAITMLLEGDTSAWAMARIGVLAPLRRRGVGSALLAHVDTGVRTRTAAPQPTTLDVGAWVPSGTAEGFAAHHGFTHARYFWLMERPLGPPPAPAWPDGVTLRTYDGSARMLSEWSGAYHRGFAEHWHFVRVSDEQEEALTRQSHFRPEGLGLAYRDGVCLGFCRCSLFGERGEIGLLAVVPEARGIGLGRALLRWGVDWLQHQKGISIVELRVDGENANALGLYRSEGFETRRTREAWSRPITSTAR
jgi:mycothiol synthase